MSIWKLLFLLTGTILNPNPMPQRKRLMIKGKPAAYYEIEVDVLFLKTISDAVSEEQAIKLISEIENTKFKFVSYLNLETLE